MIFPAGSLIWINFDRHALLSLVHKLGGTFVANVDDVRPQFQTDDNVFLSQNAIFNQTLVRTNGLSADATIDQLSGQRLDTVSGFKTEAQAWYSDQVLPFDITLAGTNENGAATCMKIFGVEILNEGSGISIDDAVTEMQATFVARYVEPWQVVNSPFRGQIGGRPSSSRRELKSVSRGRGSAAPSWLFPDIWAAASRWRNLRLAVGVPTEWLWVKALARQLSLGCSSGRWEWLLRS